MGKPLSVFLASDCQVSEWTGWGQCGAESGEKEDSHCGKGIELRERHVLRESEHGGESCPHLEENRICYASCESVQSGT